MIRLLSDQIPQYWGIINYGALAAYSLLAGKETRRRDFSVNLLINLMTGRAQCWFVVENETKAIKVVIITKIVSGIADTKHLLVDAVYGYAPTTNDEKYNFYEDLMAFARNTHCESVTMITTNNMAMNAAAKAGFIQTHKVYTARVQ